MLTIVVISWWVESLNSIVVLNCFDEFKTDIWRVVVMLFEQCFDVTFVFAIKNVSKFLSPLSKVYEDFGVRHHSCRVERRRIHYENTTSVSILHPVFHSFSKRAKFKESFQF